jgi:branched-chain amino acid transport system permease protein
MLDNLQLLFVYAPVMNIQMILDGIFVGAVFALSAYGLALVWGVMNVKNLAQGDFVIMGGYVAFSLYKLGIVYIMIIRRVIDNDMFVSLLATFGLSLLLQQVMNLIYGPEVQTIDSHFPIFTMFDDFVTIPVVKIVSLALAMIFALAVVIFMKKSRMGQAIRATAQDARAARVLGINTDNVYAFTYSLNASICGVAGVLVSMIWVLQPFYGIVYSLRTFAIVTAAGLGNLPAVIGMSFALGWVEQYAGIIAGAEWQVASAVFMLLGVLMWRQIQLRRQRQVVR